MVTHADQKVQKDFAVGLEVGSGTIVINTVKDIYIPGDGIIIIGTTNADTLLQISLTDPNGLVVKSIQAFADKTGHFSSFAFTIPPIATPGTWKLDATSGINHVSKNITVKSSSQTITLKVDRESGIYTRGDLIAISGTDAGSDSNLSISIGNSAGIVETLETTSTSSGEYTTDWVVPNNIKTGTYTISISSPNGKSTLGITIQ